MRARAIFETWVVELREGIKNGKPVMAKPVKEIRFFELADKYLEFTKDRLKSHYNLKCFVGTLVKRFGDKNLNDFTVFDLENMQSDIVKKFSISYANRLVVIAKVMFNKALDWELVNEETVKKLKRCKILKGEVKRLRYLSEEEAERFISNCEPQLKPFIITALNTGMRKSEMLNLTWDRVDLRNRLILLDITKNGERREIPINDTLYQALSGITRRIDCKYVFYNPQTLKPFARALVKSHILDFRIHDLRHTFASRLIMKGVDLTTVKELLGHKDIKMTLRYAHLSQAHVKTAIHLLDEKKIHKEFIVDENKKLSKL